jgi:hypothetical protein
MEELFAHNGVYKVELHSAQAEGVARRVRSQTLLTMIGNRARQRFVCLKALLMHGFPSWKRGFRPCAPGVAGLAIAVVLLGGGYKLSRYHFHAPPSSVSVVKLWFESRNAFLIAASRVNVNSRLVRGSRAFFAPNQRLPHQQCVLACRRSTCVPSVAFFIFLIPFRSPPSPRFFLA